MSAPQTNLLGGRNIKLLLLGIAIAAILPYLNSLSCGFAYDDIQLLEKDPHLGESLGSILKLFSEDYWTPSLESGLYRPLTKVSYGIERLLFGSAPGIHHGTNVLLHVLICLLLFALGRDLGLTANGAGAASLLFAVHPIHTEAVTGIVGRADLLSVLLMIAAFRAHLRLGRSRDPGAGVWGSLFPGILFLGAMLAKEVAVSFLALVLIADLALGRRDRLRVLLLVYAPLLGLQFLLRWMATDRLFPEPPYFVNNPILEASGVERFVTSLALFGRACFQILFPVRLSADYSWKAIEPNDDIIAVFPILGLLVLAGMVVAGFRFRNRGLFWIASGWFVLPYGVVANLLTPIGTIYGERLLYLPSVGLALLAGLGFRSPGSTSPKSEARHRVVLVGILLLLGVYSVRTCLRNEVWRDEVTLFQDAADRQPLSIKAHFLLGLGLQRHGRDDEAEAALKESVRIEPSYDHGYLALGRLYLRRGKNQEAVAAFSEAFRLSSEPSVGAEAAWRLGALSLLDGDPGTGAEWLRQALEIRPDRPDFHSDLGTALMALGEFSEAVYHLEEALRLGPERPELRRQLQDAKSRARGEN